MTAGKDSNPFTGKLWDNFAIKGANKLRFVSIHQARFSPTILFTMC